MFGGFMESMLLGDLSQSQVSVTSSVDPYKI